LNKHYKTIEQSAPIGVGGSERVNTVYNQKITFFAIWQTGSYPASRIQQKTIIRFFEFFLLKCFSVVID